MVFCIVTLSIMNTNFLTRVLCTLLIGQGLMADESKHINLDVVPFVQQIVVNEPFEIALVFSMSEDWHIYWQNPGDAGMPTHFQWDLPAGVSLLQMQEPVPSRHVEEGITTFIHENEAVYLFKFLASNTLPETSVFGVNVEWLECKSICLSGSAQLEFSIPGFEEKRTSGEGKQRLYRRSQTRFPHSTDLFTNQVSRRGNHIEIDTKLFTDVRGEIIEVDFFPYAELIYDISHVPQLRSRFLRSQKIVIPLLNAGEDVPHQLHGVLKIMSRSGGNLGSATFLINETIHL